MISHQLIACLFPSTLDPRSHLILAVTASIWLLLCFPHFIDRTSKAKKTKPIAQDHPAAERLFEPITSSFVVWVLNLEPQIPMEPWAPWILSTE